MTKKRRRRWRVRSGVGPLDAGLGSHQQRDPRVWFIETQSFSGWGRVSDYYSSVAKARAAATHWFGPEFVET